MENEDAPKKGSDFKIIGLRMAGLAVAMLGIAIFAGESKSLFAFPTMITGGALVSLSLFFQIRL